MSDSPKYSGEHIESLMDMAGEHLFMHAMQTNDWRKNGLKIFVEGQGVWVTDIEGNRLLDMMGGLWYKATGYGRKEIADAVYKQMMAISSPPANSTAVPTVELSGKIAELYHDHDARVFFTSGGSESVETAVKMAKKYQNLTGKSGAFKVISRRNSYHGSTAMAVSLGRNASADPMGPEMPGAIHVMNTTPGRCAYCVSNGECNLSCANEIETVIQHQGPETVAAIIAEPVSAAAGIHIPHPEYWPSLRQIADRYSVLLIADEVITGFGRLGEWFGPMNWDVKPDITVVAKALTSGYAPLGAAIATKTISDAFLGGDNETFRHLITFGGHPVSTAAALANLEIFEKEDLVGNSRRMGIYLYEQLQSLRKYQSVGDIRGGMGLLAVVELVQNRDTGAPFPKQVGLAQRLPKMLYDRGLVSFRAGDIIAMCPPLTVTKDDVDFIVNGLDETIRVLERDIGIG